MDKQQNNMIICITGGSGFIGTQMTKHFVAQGHQVIIFDLVAPKVSHPNVSFFKLNIVDDEIPSILETCDVVVHLSGASIFNRWTTAYKKEIYYSRILSTRKLVEFFSIHKPATHKPITFVCASAVGFYGEGGEDVSKNRIVLVMIFWHRCVWIGSMKRKKQLSTGIRVVSIRTGIVLGTGGGMLAKLVPIFRLGLGGQLGTGKQWFSWIHMEDVIAIYEAAVLDTRLSGPVNAVTKDCIAMDSSWIRSHMHSIEKRSSCYLDGF